MQARSFVHLHVHSYYSLLDGACPIDALTVRARELNMPALALTDHGNMFGAVEFFHKASKAGVKPIIGCEVYLLFHGSRRERERKLGQLHHITLLAQNREGYRNLCRLVSTAYLEGFYYKPRIDMEALCEHAEGIVALSGCGRGVISTLLQDGREQEARVAAERFSSLFPGRFYLEIMDHGMPDQQAIRAAVVDMARSMGLPLVATNDVHYLYREQASMQDALMCIQTGKALGDQERMRMNTDQLYFKSAEEMQSVFSDIPEALDNTLSLAESLNVDLHFKQYHFPHFEPPSGKNVVEYFEQLSCDGLAQRMPEVALRRKSSADVLLPEYRERLNGELAMIKHMGFAGYFLIVADFINFAKQQGIAVGPGRGSAAGSLVAYCLGITDIDPIEHGLLFERFLNPERISMPDMDIDFCMRRRDEVIDYVSKKYGNVSQIITFGKMKARAVLRDVGRVMGLPYGDVDRIAKLVPPTLGMTLEKALEVEPKLSHMAEEDPQVKRLLEIAKGLEGFPRHASTHAAGVVISDQPLTEYVPLCRGQEEEVVTQYDMKAVEQVGLIKFDFLGLKTLTVIEDAIALIAKSTGDILRIAAIPLDDPLVYRRLSEGDTKGVFQLESQGMTDLILKLKPNSFADIIALVALFRPGPLGSGMVDDFINRKHGRTKIAYELPQLEPILRDTYGVIVYQEQVMQIASVLANFSLGDADLLRRAMGKKDTAVMATQREKFVQGAVANGISTTKSERIFDLMAKFAEYGFNKSHSAAYALVSYHTAYLKYHYRTEYMAAVLTGEQGNTEKVLEYIGDCREHGVDILPPDVNESHSDFSVIEEGKIRFGLAAVKNVGESAVENIVEIRNAGGAFSSLFDFCERVDSRRVNKRVMESLIKCGAFDFCKASRAAMMSSLDRAMELAAGQQRDRASGQVRLFDLVQNNGVQPTEHRLDDVPEWPERQRLQFEKEALGFYITGHPLLQFAPFLSTYATSDTKKLSDVADRTEVKIGGVVSRMREITTRRGDRMAFVTLEDLRGAAEVVIFSDLYGTAQDLLKSDRPVFIVGTADADDESVKIIAQNIFPLEEVPKLFTKSIHFFLPAVEVSSDAMNRLKEILVGFPGPCPAFLHLLDPQEAETILALPDTLRLSPEPALASALERAFGKNIMHFESI